jgi:hypothetical protein
MNKTIIVVIGLALAGAAFTLTAQPAPGRGGPGPHRFGAQGFQPPIATVLGVNADGVLTETEIAQVPAQLLALDKNQDGQLTTDEFCAGGPGRGGQNCPWGTPGQAGQGRGQGKGRGLCAQGQNPLFLRLFDADGDKLLSNVEINNAPAILRALDVNQDGRLTADELRPQAGNGRGNGKGYGNGQCQGRQQACLRQS